ncbi:MAG: DUF6288 domain-containing protein, partial [Akkermansiaceae bacterium]
MKLPSECAAWRYRNSRCLAGGTQFTVVLLLLLVGVIAGIHWKTRNSQPQAEAQPEPQEEAETVQGQVVHGTPIEPTKKVETPVAQKEDIKAPEPVIPQPEVAKEKTPVDLLLEKHFPLPDFKPLEEIVKNWQTVPKRAMPEKVTVNVKLSYSGDDSAQSLDEQAGHQAMPLMVVNKVVTLGNLQDPRARATVKIEDTDLQAQVGKLYQEKKQEAFAKVLEQREQNRDKAVAYLAKQNDQSGKEVAKKDTPRLSDIEDDSDSADDGDFSAKRYGKKYRNDYWAAPKNGKNSQYDHEVPMGPMCGIMSVLYEKREAKIISLWDKGPAARAGLEVGDLLIKVDGKRFDEYGKKAAAGGKGAPEQLGMAMIDAQGSQRPVVLTIKRKGEEMEIAVDLPAAPPFKEDFPKDCTRSQALSKAAAEYLLEQQDKGTGKWRANDYTNAWCGLALLATGEKKYASEIKKLARTTAKKYDLGTGPSKEELIEGGNGKGAASNWFVCISGIFLAEYYLATEDKMVLDALEHCCRSMDIRIHTENGRFGHSRDREHLPYGGT